MPAIKSRSTAPRNLVEFRHPLFFADEDVTSTGDDTGIPLYPEFIAQLQARAESLVAHEMWLKAPANTRGEEPQLAPEPDLKQYVDTVFDKETCERIGVPYEGAYYADKPRDTVWRFRRIMQNVDEDLVTGMMAAVQIDWKALASEFEEEKDLPKIETNTRSLYQRALLEVMSVDAEGLYFTFLPTLTKGDVDGTDNEEIDEMAGKLIPLTSNWLWKFNPDMVRSAFSWLQKQLERRTPAQEATFPAILAPVPNAGSTANGRRKTRAN